MSATKSRVETLLAANAEFAASYTIPPTMAQLRENDGDGVIVLTCLDPRVVPEQFLGPDPRVAVFRNAGGRYSSDALRSIVLLRSLLYKAPKITVMVVHHSDCGVTRFKEEQIMKDIKARGAGMAEDLKDLDFALFSASEHEKALREDIDKLRASKLLEGVEVKGYMLSLETGGLQEM